MVKTSAGVSLPEQAQEIYKEAFDHAWEQNSGSFSKDNDSLAQVCNKAAWSAVKKKYRKWWKDRWKNISRP